MSQFNVENLTTCAEEPDTDTDRVSVFHGLWVMLLAHCVVASSRSAC